MTRAAKLAAFSPLATLAAAAVLVSCLSRREPPQYMQDAPKGEIQVRQAMEEIRKELGEEFIIEHVDDLYFVAGNDGQWSFDACKGTIRRVTTFLTTHYFERKPEKPLRVFLFRNKATYDDYVQRTYGREPSTPYGFYLSSERKMIMNISTGTGTLAHELVHPLLAEDFPAVPAWFNEGFASLFEESRTREDGTMYGVVNWRLPALQKAIAEGQAVSIESVMKCTTSQFYAESRGLNYAVARYLCFWLQERGLLRDYFAALKAGANEDPQGIAALEKVAGGRLATLEEAWRAWVTTLEYRR